jgi:aryl-alcohol dehydrogenase-like predicted oxidoreductase
MDYVRLGSTGLQVFRLVLGCMSFGDPKRGAHRTPVPPATDDSDLDDGGREKGAAGARCVPTGRSPKPSLS